MKKKTLAICLSILTLLSLAACGGTKTPAATGDASTSAEPAAGAVAYTVGILQQLEHPALDSATEGFKAALTDTLGVAVSFDYANAQNDLNNCTIIANKFVNDGVDLIMANATTALQAAASATDKIPVIGTSITDYESAGVLKGDVEKPGGNVTGASDLAPLDKQAELLLEVCPDVETIGIIYCSSEPNSIYQAEKIGEYLTSKGKTVKTYTVADSNEIQSVLTAAVEEIDALYVPTDNTLADNAELIRNITILSKTPVLAGEEGVCRTGGLITLSISYYDMGYSAGLLAADILTGKVLPADAPIVYSKEVSKLYNVEIAEILGITMPEGVLPLE